MGAKIVIFGKFHFPLYLYPVENAQPFETCWKITQQMCVTSFLCTLWGNNRPSRTHPSLEKGHGHWTKFSFFYILLLQQLNKVTDQNRRAEGPMYNCILLKGVSRWSTCSKELLSDVFPQPAPASRKYKQCTFLTWHCFWVHQSNK